MFQTIYDITTLQYIIKLILLYKRVTSNQLHPYIVLEHNAQYPYP